jgi:hypothetical protein
MAVNLLNFEIFTCINFKYFDNIVNDKYIINNNISKFQVGKL